VQTRTELVKALDDQRWDVVLVDFKLPQFDAFGVLELIQQREEDLPVILVTGALPEESQNRILGGNCVRFYGLQ